MKKEEYLDMRGFSNEDYALMTKEQLGDLLSKPGAMNNTFAANDPKGKTFGAGAYVVKRSWAKEHMTEAPKTEEAVTENIPVAPPVPSPPIVPTPPTKPEATEEGKPVAETVAELPPLVKTRIANLVAKGWMVHKDSVQSKDVIVSFKKLAEMTNEEYTSLIIVKQPEPIAEEQVKDFLCLNQAQSGQAKCKDQCGYCATQDVSPSEEATEAIQTIEAETAEEIETAEIEAEIDTEIISDEDFQKEIEEEKPMMDVKVVIETEVEEEAEQTEFEKIQEIADASPNIHIVGVPKIEPIKPEQIEKVVELSEKAKSFEKPDQINSDMTYGDTTGFFSQLSVFGFQQLNLTVNKIAAGKLTVIVKPQNFSGDPAYDDIQPLVLTATAEDLDKEFFEAIGQPLKVVNGLMSNAQEFIKNAKKKEKETKEQEAKKAEVKKLVDAAKKFHTDDKEFDFKKSGTSAKKKWDKVIELDPDNVDAKKGIAALEALANKEDSTLKL